MVLRPVVLLAVWPVGLALLSLGLQVECQAGLLALPPVVVLVWESLVSLIVVSRGLLVVLGAVVAVRLGVEGGVGVGIDGAVGCGGVVFSGNGPVDCGCAAAHVVAVVAG